MFIVKGHICWRNEVRNELLDVPDISDEDITAAEDEAVQTDLFTFTSSSEH